MENKRPMPGGTDLKTQVNVTTIEGNLQARSGIPPYKLKVMLKQADRIYDQLMGIPQFVTTYDDIEFVLELLLESVQKARQE